MLEPNLRSVVEAFWADPRCQTRSTPPFPHWRTEHPGPWATVHIPTDEHLALWWMEIEGTYWMPRHVKHHQQWLFVERSADGDDIPNHTREVEVYHMVALAQWIAEIVDVIPLHEAGFGPEHRVHPSRPRCGGWTPAVDSRPDLI